MLGCPRAVTANARIAKQNRSGLKRRSCPVAVRILVTDGRIARRAHSDLRGQHYGERRFRARRVDAKNRRLIGFAPIVTEGPTAGGPRDTPALPATCRRTRPAPGNGCRHSYCNVARTRPAWRETRGALQTLGRRPNRRSLRA